MQKHKITGMTLLEVMLVFAIAAALILAGLRVYQSSERDKNYLILRSNVDFLFQAMKQYYQQQCDLFFSTEGAINGKGDLTFSPDGASTEFNTTKFDVTKMKNYMDFPWPRYVSVVVNDTVDKTYFAQFNPSTSSINANKNAYVCSSFRTGKPECSAPTQITGSSIVLWQSQIAVKMRDPSTTTYYVAMAGADCAVNTVPTDAPVDCSAGVAMGTSAQYMVWQRMPSFSTPNVRSSHWISNPVTKEFKLQYTHDPMYELYNPDALPTDVYKYYYCGG